jgi:hypothetical protein
MAARYIGGGTPRTCHGEPRSIKPTSARSSLTLQRRNTKRPVLHPANDRVLARARGNGLRFTCIRRTVRGWRAIVRQRGREWTTGGKAPVLGSHDRVDLSRT